MRGVAILMLVLLMLVPATAFAEGIPANPFDIQPISPEELAGKVSRVGENVVELGQGVAPPAMWIAFVVAAGLIFIGLPLMIFTKKIFSSGILILVGMGLMYVLVFHPESVVGVVKGVFSAGQ